MKLYFMKQDAVDFMKHNMERLYTHYFQDETNEWMTREYGSDLFSEFMEVPDFELAEIDAMSIGEVDFENCKILYNNLRSLSESQCSDERLWAGLCNSTFYGYMRRRYQYPSKQLKKKETDIIICGDFWRCWAKDKPLSIIVKIFRRNLTHKRTSLIKHLLCRHRTGSPLRANQHLRTKAPKHRHRSISG